jgi:hypothetical protein
VAAGVGRSVGVVGVRCRRPRDRARPHAPRTRGALVARGIDVRAKAPVKNDGSVGLLAASGFEPLFHQLERPGATH